ncbi:MAG: transcription termination factor NusA [Spirochaetes bacterium]|nr:transcription termination factor NusA [Spirochaetota bacterium]
MKLDLNLIVKELQQEKSISQELIMNTIEVAIAKAYEKCYGTISNLMIRHDDDLIISIFSKKEVVKEVQDDLYEISLNNAKEIDEAAEEGDEMLVPCNPEEFGRIAIHSAKQIIFQRLKEMKKDTVYSDYKAKIGELIIGYVQRVRGDTIYIDLGNYEGILPKKNQAAHEIYKPGDRIKTIVEDVKKTNKGNINIILSRTSTEFIKRLLEVEIPEIYDKVIEIKKIAREAGYRTKIAVYTSKDEIDPVGACVGQKGNRIANIIKELEGEKIDVVKWSNDPKIMIANALTPAKINNVVIDNEKSNNAIVIVDESQLSYAIGKKGLNIKLANILSEWSIDVKTIEQAIELNLITDHVQAAEQLFKEEISKNEIDQLDLDDDIKEVLKNNSIKTIEEIIEIFPDQIKNITGVTDDISARLKKYIDDNFEVVFEEESNKEANEEEVVYYECPECGHQITETDTSCPNCGVEIAFEEDD